jgi:hypothetical protein
MAAANDRGGIASTKRRPTAANKGTDMDTSKYDSATRKNVKRFQRSPAYQVLKKEHGAVREALETKLRQRDGTIEMLKKKLVESGVAADEVAKLA